MAEIGSQPNPEIALLDKMKQVIPNVDEDLIVLYVGITGKDVSGSIRIKERSLRIEPSFVGSHKLKAIQTTTAAPMLEAARMLLSGKYKGPMLQSQIDTQEFLSGSFVQMVFNQKKYRELV